MVFEPPANPRAREHRLRLGGGVVLILARLVEWLVFAMSMVVVMLAFATLLVVGRCLGMVTDLTVP